MQMSQMTIDPRDGDGFKKDSDEDGESGSIAIQQIEKVEPSLKDGIEINAL